MEITTVEAYELAEFCKKAQEAILDGYRFDFDSNERYPTSFGSYYNVILVKENKSEVSEDTKEEPKEVVKRGPKPKAKD